MVDCSLYTQLLALIGVLSILFFLFEHLWSVVQALRAILAPYFVPNEDTTLVKKFGPWALVTGSTDGIGKAYSFELARRGVNVVLASRNEERLKNTAKEIEAKYPVKTKIIAVDFSLGVKAIEKVKEEVGKLPIDILVNNVGMMYEYPTYLHEVPQQVIADVMTLNVGATTLMCHAFLPGMKDRRRGAIVNVGSGTQHQPMPLAAVYCSSKVYLRNLSDTLRCEYQQFGITVQHLVPMFVETKMNHYTEDFKLYDKARGILVLSPEVYARCAVSTLGKIDESSGHWSHGIQTFLMKCAPVWVRMYIAWTAADASRKGYLQKLKQTRPPTDGF